MSERVADRGTDQAADHHRAEHGRIADRITYVADHVADLPDRITDRGTDQTADHHRAEHDRIADLITYVPDHVADLPDRITNLSDGVAHLIDRV